MPHLLIAGKLHPAGEALLAQLGSEGVSHDYVEEISEASYAPLIDHADGLVIRTQPLSAATIARGSRLKVVSRHGVGYDAVDLEALNARGIALTIVGNVNSVSVAEHAMMQLLASAKRMLRADRAVRQGQWHWRDRLEQSEISGKRLLVIGYGRTGRHLARMAQAFDMEVRAHDPYLERTGWPDGPASPAPDLMEALGWADCISVHIPRGEKPTLGAAEFAAMKHGVLLANTARGGVVCEQSLADALRSGRVAGAGIDVFDAEPPDGRSPLIDFDTALLSPHMAGLTDEASERMALASIRNALGYLDGTIDPSLVVNRDIAYA